jgi:hypothetical protein
MWQNSNSVFRIMVGQVAADNQKMITYALPWQGQTTAFSDVHQCGRKCCQSYPVSEVYYSANLMIGNLGNAEINMPNGKR